MIPILSHETTDGGRKSGTVYPRPNAFFSVPGTEKVAATVYTREKSRVGILKTAVAIFKIAVGILMPRLHASFTL